MCRGVTILQEDMMMSGNMFKHQRIFVVSKTTSNITRHDIIVEISQLLLWTQNDLFVDNFTW